jgi:hypothetical protein
MMCSFLFLSQQIHSFYLKIPVKQEINFYAPDERVLTMREHSVRDRFCEPDNPEKTRQHFPFHPHGPYAGLLQEECKVRKETYNLSLRKKVSDDTIPFLKRPIFNLSSGCGPEVTGPENGDNQFTTRF